MGRKGESGWSEIASAYFICFVSKTPEPTLKPTKSVEAVQNPVEAPKRTEVGTSTPETIKTHESDSVGGTIDEPNNYPPSSKQK